MMESTSFPMIQYLPADLCIHKYIYIYIYRHPWIEIMHMIVVHNSIHRYHMQYLAPMNFTKAQCCSNATWKDWSQQWECDLQRLKVQEMAEFRAKHQGCLEMYWKTWWKNTNIHGILWKKHGNAVNLGKTPIHSRSLTPRPWKIDGWELGDKSFPFGFWVTFSGVNFLWNFQVGPIWWPESLTNVGTMQRSCNKNQQLSKPNLAPLPSLKL